jgi:putative transposase
MGIGEEAIMETLDDLINDATDSRETKRALTVKMLQTGLSPQSIAHLLNVSEQYVSKWKIRYEKAGVLGLRLGYQGKKPYLKEQEQLQVVEWIKTHESITLEALRDYLENQYAIIYDSKQSYYDLLSEAGMSYHRTTASNPQYDEAMVLEKREAIKKKWHSINPS